MNIQNYANLNWRRAVLAMALAVGLSGCATETLTAGASLAKAGQTAANQMAQNALVSSDTIQTFRKAVVFSDGYNGVTGNAESAKILRNQTAIQASSAQYAKLLASLATAYGALGDLSAYDASGTFNNSFSSLTKDTNAFATTVGAPSPLSDTAASAIPVSAGLIAGLIEADRVKTASRSIKTVLQGMIAILEAPRTRQLLVLNRQEVSAQIGTASTILFSEGLYTYSPLIDSFGALGGLKSVAQPDAVIAKSAKLKAGINDVFLEGIGQQADASEQSYDQSLAALKALVPLHESLEAGAPLNMDEIAAITGRLDSITVQFQPKVGK